jgi:hypothetical protein
VKALDNLVYAQMMNLHRGQFTAELVAWRSLSQHGNMLSTCSNAECPQIRWQDIDRTQHHAIVPHVPDSIISGMPVGFVQLVLPLV